MEIVSKRKMKEYAKIVCDDKMNFYVNSSNNLIFSAQKSNKRVLELSSFNKETGEIKDVLRTFTHAMPLNFLSPTFYSYIQVAYNARRIRVRETFTDEAKCNIPQHFHKYLLSSKETFSPENFVDKIIFVEEDLIMLELDKINEIIFHVPS